MKIKNLITSVFAIVVSLGFVNLAFADDSVTRTPWQMHDGFDQFDSAGKVIPIPFEPSCLTFFYNGLHYSPGHGALCEFDVAEVPEQSDFNWAPAPDPDIIGFGGPSASKLPDSACRLAGDFTYFQTFVEVPTGATVTSFTIDFNGMDDGSIVSVCDGNSCTAVPGSHVQLSNGGTTDLSSLVSEGSNRVVITQVDDCAVGNTLASAIVVLNGVTVEVPPPVVDGDGDGVPDDIDACPATPEGVTVDAVGCPLDTDEDGVEDYLDACPATPIGVTVDAVGCPLDTDEDGVEDYHDACPATPAGAIVSASGCSGAQAVSLVCGIADEYRNHGQYVSCVAHAVKDAVAAGLLTEEERGGIVSDAGQSDVGQKENSGGGKKKGK